MRDWLTLRLAVTAAQTDTVEAILEEQGALAVSMTDAEDNPLFEPPPGARPLWPRVQIEAIFGQDDEAALLRAACQNALNDALGDAAPQAVLHDIEDTDWTRVWMDAFKPMRFGQRTWIVPSWHQPPEPEAVNLRLDPGLAFGTGTHPTTALCLAWLDQHPSQSRVLDFGCGSGVLMLASLLLGTTAAVGVDLDPQALEATQTNAERNGLQDKIALYLPENAPAETYPTVVANILSGPLVALAPQLSRHVETGGHLALSGLLAEQAADVMAAYPDFDFATPETLEGWCLLVGQKR